MDARRLLSAADQFQQRHNALAFGVATWKKFGDDQAGNLAALIAYYAFVSIFPLLLVLVTVLDLTLHGNPDLRDRLVNSALSQYPVIGRQLHVHSLNETGLALAIGLVGTFLGARGVAGALQNALNSAWEVPQADRPGFPWSLLRSLGLILVVGPGEIATIALSGLAGGTGHVLTGVGARIAAVVISLVLNALLFWLAFRLGTARQVRTRDMLVGAVIAAVAWQLLQLLGGYIVAHQLARNSALYGTFAIVLGLIAWLYLQAQITLYAVELNVVKVRQLWPRSLFPPPLTSKDMTAYRMYAHSGQRRPELKIELKRVDGKTGPSPAKGGQRPPQPEDSTQNPAETTTRPSG
ncbi:MAG TPA: YihY/virulence factor BrkB family protein [Streptosporangiaceae bacterium]